MFGSKRKVFESDMVQKEKPHVGLEPTASRYRFIGKMIRSLARYHCASRAGMMEEKVFGLTISIISLGTVPHALDLVVHHQTVFFPLPTRQLDHDPLDQWPPRQRLLILSLSVRSEIRTHQSKHSSINCSGKPSILRMQLNLYFISISASRALNPFSSRPPVLAESLFCVRRKQVQPTEEGFTG